MNTQRNRRRRHVKRVVLRPFQPYSSLCPLFKVEDRHGKRWWTLAIKRALGLKESNTNKL
jgi:hypothetical protein